MREMNSYALFVRDGERTGILTRSDLVNAAILERQPIEWRRSRGPADRFRCQART